MASSTPTFEHHVEWQPQRRQDTTSLSTSGAWPSYNQYARSRNSTHRQYILGEPYPELASGGLIWLSVKRLSSPGTLEQVRSISLTVDTNGPPRELLDLIQETTLGDDGDSVHMLMITIFGNNRMMPTRVLILNYIACHLGLPEEKLRDLRRGSEPDSGPGQLLHEDLFYLSETSAICNVVQCTVGNRQLGIILLPCNLLMLMTHSDRAGVRIFGNS